MKKRQIKTSFTRWGVCATVCTRFNRTGLQNPKWSGNVLSSVMEQYNTNVFVSKLFKTIYILFNMKKKLVLPCHV